MKSRFIGKDLDAGKDWGQEEKGMTEDEMFGWHHQLNGHEFEWTPGVGDGQGGLGYCSPWVCKESDTTEWLNWTELPLLYWQMGSLPLAPSQKPLTVSRLNAPTKRRRLAGRMKACTCMHFHLSHHSACPSSSCMQLFCIAGLIIFQLWWQL